MERIIELEARQRYGSWAFHPKNELGKKVAELLRTKTISPAKFDLLEELGFRVDISGEIPLGR